VTELVQSYRASHIVIVYKKWSGRTTLYAFALAPPVQKHLHMPLRSISPDLTAICFWQSIIVILCSSDHVSVYSLQNNYIIC